MTQSFEGESTGQGGSDMGWRDQGAGSGSQSFASGADRFGQGQTGAQEFGRKSSSGQGGQEGMFGDFGRGQAGEMVDSVRDFGRNNPTALIGGGVLALLALAGYAGASGRFSQDWRSHDRWQGSQRSFGGQYGRGRNDEWRNRGEGGREGFSGGSHPGAAGTYSGASYSGRSPREHSYYPSMRTVRSYGLNHPIALTAGAALAAFALSRLMGNSSHHEQRSRYSGDWQKPEGSFSGSDARSQGSEGRQTFTGPQSGSPYSASGTSSTSERDFGGSSSSGQSYGSGTMGSEPVEASGSSSDSDRSATTSFTSGSRAGAGSASTGGL